MIFSNTKLDEKHIHIGRYLVILCKWGKRKGVQWTNPGGFPLGHPATHRLCTRSQSGACRYWQGNPPTLGALSLCVEYQPQSPGGPSQACLVSSICRGSKRPGLSRLPPLLQGNLTGPPRGAYFCGERTTGPAQIGRRARFLVGFPAGPPPSSNQTMKPEKIRPRKSRHRASPQSQPGLEAEDGAINMRLCIM